MAASVGSVDTDKDARASGLENCLAAWMGERIFDGRTGPWLSEARLVNPQAQVLEARSSGRMESAAPGTHHLIFYLAEPRPKTPILVRGAKGTVSVTAPDGRQVTKDLARMDGHFGADVVLGKPGAYRFVVDIESGGRKGTTTFAYSVE